MTTRPPRPNEIGGVHYYFVDRDRFDEMAGSGHLLEWAEYSGNLYGTPRRPVAEWLQSGESVLLDIELRGARQIRATFPDALLIFIAPPSMVDLEKRLATRGDTDPEQVADRLELARRQIEEAPDLFDHIVVNDTVEQAVEDIERILAFPQPEDGNELD